eukprot:7273891-Alexandrium_andersonii.AAC.1
MCIRDSRAAVGSQAVSHSQSEVTSHSFVIARVASTSRHHVARCILGKWKRSKSRREGKRASGAPEAPVGRGPGGGSPPGEAARAGGA